MAVFHVRGRRPRRLWLVGSTLAAFAIFAVVFVTASSANLVGCTFEGNDGNLVVTTAGNTDWDNAPNRVVGIDLPSGSNDNAFGQGTKEDAPAVSVVTGSIPPNKNDLTRFYVGSDYASGSNYLDLAWERAVNIGSANLDLEINQNATAGFTGTTTALARRMAKCATSSCGQFCMSSITRSPRFTPSETSRAARRSASRITSRYV